MTGRLVPLDAVPDVVFAGRTVGDGCAIDPTIGEVVAPCAGRVVQVHRAGHALTLDADGVELLIHVGIETVRLGGVGFTPLVTAGTVVAVGTPLLRVDLDAVAQQARSLVTPIIITGGAAAIEPLAAPRAVVAGRDPVARIRRGAPAPSAIVRDASAGARAADERWSEPLVLRDAAGLHARPAAALVAIARRYTAALVMEAGGRTANLHSLVDLLALEVGPGTTVRLRAHGADAEEALAALVEVLVGLAPAIETPVETSIVEGILHGIPAAPGIAIGAATVLRSRETVAAPERAADPAAERHALDEALRAADLDLATLAERLASEGQGERAAIFAAHRELLTDPTLIDATAASIREGWTAAWGWSEAVRRQAERVERLRDPRLAARSADVRDVGRRVLRALRGASDTLATARPGCIAIAEEFTPSDVVQLARTGVRGIAAVIGGASGHAAILARGLGLPAVMGIDPAALELSDATRVCLDGDAGTLRLAPGAALEAEVATRVAQAAVLQARIQADAAEPAITRDGIRIPVRANIAAAAEVPMARAAGADGIGLFRTELALEGRSELPSLEEQAAWYAAAAREATVEAPATIRLLDVGGDKPVPALSGPMEPNPALGERGIRRLLARPAVLRTQLRAILHAAAAGPTALLVPMVGTLEEWALVRTMLEEERAALGVPVHGAPTLALGAMIETAAAALRAEHLAATADFLSIGTNDLAQYTLAIDRTHPRLAPQLDVLDPAVLALIARTVAGAQRHGRPVSVCGTAAGDPEAIPILLGLGVTALSVELALVPAVKARVRSLSLAECRATASLALEAPSAAAVRAMVATRHPEGR